MTGPISREELIYADRHVFAPTHVTVRGNWRREIDGVDELGISIDLIPIDGEHRPRYYWRRLRVPWLAWAMFS